MKVYTEIVYTWDSDKNKLVEESSKSFDYEGPVVQCHTRKQYGVNIPHAHGGEMGKVTAEVTKTQDKATSWAKRNKMDKPGGDVKKQVTDVVRKWSTDAETMMWGHSSADNPPAASSDDSEALAALNRSRKTRLGPGREGEDKDSDERRGLVNMSMGTLLTQGQKAKKLPTA